jgi:hypothetical protein
MIQSISSPVSVPPFGQVIDQRRDDREMRADQRFGFHFREAPATFAYGFDTGKLLQAFVDLAAHDLLDLAARAHLARRRHLARDRQDAFPKRREYCLSTPLDHRKPDIFAARNCILERHRNRLLARQLGAGFRQASGILTVPRCTLADILDVLFANAVQIVSAALGFRDDALRD